MKILDWRVFINLSFGQKMAIFIQALLLFSKKKKKVLTIYKNAWISLCWDFCIEHYVYDICNLLCHICLSISFLRSV